MRLGNWWECRNRRLWRSRTIVALRGSRCSGGDMCQGHIAVGNVVQEATRNPDDAA